MVIEQYTIDDSSSLGNGDGFVDHPGDEAGGEPPAIAGSRTLAALATEELGGAEDARLDLQLVAGKRIRADAGSPESEPDPAAQLRLDRAQEILAEMQGSGNAGG